MDHLFEKNASLLALTDPSLAEQIRIAAVRPGARVTMARSGAPTLVVDGISMHSRFDPVAEAETWAKSTAVLAVRDSGITPAIFGLGLGYHVLAVSPIFQRLIVMEPDPGLIRLAFMHIDFADVLAKCQLSTHPRHEREFLAATVLPHAPSTRLHRQTYSEFRAWFESHHIPKWHSEIRRVDELRPAWESIPGMSRLLDRLGRNEAVMWSDLFLAARQSGGEPTRADITLLLLGELSAGGMDADETACRKQREDLCLSA